MCCFFASLGLCYFLYIVRKAKLVKSMFSPSLLSWPRLWSLHGRKLKMCAELSTAGQNTSESREVLTLVRRSRLQLSAANSLYKTVPRPCFMQPLEFILGSRKLCSPLILNTWCLAHLKGVKSHIFPAMLLGHVPSFFASVLCLQYFFRCSCDSGLFCIADFKLW